MDILAPNIEVEFSSTFDVELLGVATMVGLHLLPVTCISTFDDYATQFFSHTL